MTEAEFIALVQCVQEMLYVKKVLNSMELQVELPMIVYCDNKGAVDMANGWNIGGGTKHMDIRVAFIRELKESGDLLIKWISTNDNTADIFTKNTDSKTFNHHIPALLGNVEKVSTSTTRGNDNGWNSKEAE